MEAIAGIRFAITEIATLLKSNSFATKPRLIEQLQSDCTDKSLNSTDFTIIGDAFGPAIYLLKVLVRQHGFFCLNEVFHKYQWIVPKGLHTTDQVLMLSSNWIT